MKITKYFTQHTAWNAPVDACNNLIEEKEEFLTTNKKDIAKIDSEDLKVEFCGNNHCICILKLTYYEK
jgi:hypothetical protein